MREAVNGSEVVVGGRSQKMYETVIGTVAVVADLPAPLPKAVVVVVAVLPVGENMDYAFLPMTMRTKAGVVVEVEFLDEAGKLGFVCCLAVSHPGNLWVSCTSGLVLEAGTLAKVHRHHSHDTLGAVAFCVVLFPCLFPFLFLYLSPSPVACLCLYLSKYDQLWLLPTYGPNWTKMKPKAVVVPTG